MPPEFPDKNKRQKRENEISNEISLRVNTTLKAAALGDAGNRRLAC